MTIDGLSLITWLVVGVVAGGLAHKVAKSSGLSRLGSYIAGAFGACAGGTLLTQFDVIAPSFQGDLVAATMGAVFLLVVLGLIKGT